jgi:site-specific DNA recombinase
VVSKQSRLGRHMIETAHTVMLIADAGVRVFSYLDDAEISVEDEVAQAHTMLKSFASASERRQASRRVYDSALRRVRAGQIAGAKIFGYDNVAVPGPGGKRLHTLRRVNAEQAAVVQRIFTLYAEGEGSVLIARQLNAERVPAPRPKGWSQTGIRGILNNRIYRGEMVWGKRHTVIKKGRERHERVPPEQWIRLTQPELRIIDEALWQRVEAIREGKRETLPRRVASGQLLGRPSWRDGHSEYLLPGFLTCSLCGGNVRTITSRAGDGRPRKLRRHYGCAEAENRGPAVCRNDVRLYQEVLDHAILTAIGALLDERIIAAAVNRAIAELQGADRQALDRRPAIERELALVQHRLNRGLDSYLNGAGPLEESLRLRLAEDAARREALVAELAGLADVQQRAEVNVVDLTRDLQGRAGDVRALLGRHVSQARQMLRKLLAAPIRVRPVAEGARRGFAFEGTLTFDRLLGGTALAAFPAGETRGGTSAAARARAPRGCGCRGPGAASPR